MCSFGVETSLSRFLSDSLLRLPLVDSPAVEKVCSTGAVEQGFDNYYLMAPPSVLIIIVDLLLVVGLLVSVLITETIVHFV